MEVGVWTLSDVTVISVAVRVHWWTESEHGFLCRVRNIYILCDKKIRLGQHWLLGLLQERRCRLNMMEESRTQLLQGEAFTARHSPDWVPAGNWANHAWSGFELSMSSAERDFCALPGIPTSGLSLCVFTESTPKYTDSTLHPEWEQTTKGSLRVRPSGSHLGHNGHL